MRKVFDPKKWLVTQKSHQPLYPQKQTARHIQLEHGCTVENLIKTIENRGVDLTVGYENWRNIAFALASEFGESGRWYFHSLSRFNSDYNSSECDRQYSNCLKSGGNGITIATLFWMAKNSGIIFNNKNND